MKILPPLSSGCRLLTRPIVFTEKLPTLGTTGDIILVDLSQYALGLRKELYLEKSNAVNWSTDLTNYRITVRANGQGKWSGAFTPKAGSTLSWCVSLETRS